MSPSITTEQTVAVELAPELRNRLLLKLREYQFNAIAIKALEADNAAIKVETEGMLADAGEGAALDAGLNVEGFKVKMVYPTRSKLEPKKLVALGVSTQQIAEATVVRPGKHYVKITSPGEREDDIDEP